jgi:hypothetical protein
MMKSSVLPWCIAAVLVGNVFAASAEAAAVKFYQPDTDTDTIVDGQGLTRETHFRALDDVQLVQIGVLFDPLDDEAITVRWHIHASNVNKQLLGPVFSSSDIVFADAGLKQYNTGVSFALEQDEYYVLAMELVAGSFEMPEFHENDQNLPFITSDGNFQVGDGGVNGHALYQLSSSNTSGNWPNVVLPAFSVTIPEPASITLIACSAGLVMRRRRRG